jgi:hypothetical protein
MSAVATKTVATWIVARDAGDIYWRAQAPARHLGARLIVVPKRNSRNFLYPNSSNKRGAFRWQQTPEGASYPDVEGTVVWTRPDINRAVHGAAMSANGHRVICEVDDNYLSKQSQNIFMRINEFGPAARLQHMQAFATMDAIICSTEWLRDEYHKAFTQELRYVPDLYVARNHAEGDDVRWRPRERTWDKLRVGIQGSYQHVHDWRLAAPALHLAKDLGCEIVFMGLDPAEHDPAWKTFLGEYTHIPWDDPKKYHQRQIPFDIGLAPLVTTRHTLGKSDIKGLEYAMSGVAAVLQNNAVYNRDWRHNETCLLAGSPDEMANCVFELVRSAKLRRDLVGAARDYVREERLIEDNIDEWRGPVLG